MDKERAHQTGKRATTVNHSQKKACTIAFEFNVPDDEMHWTSAGVMRPEADQMPERVQELVHRWPLADVANRDQGHSVGYPRRPTGGGWRDQRSFLEL